MKDVTREQLEEGRPRQLDPRAAIDFALSALFAEQEHDITDEVVVKLTFEELLGALLLARDFIDQARRESEE